MPSIDTQYHSLTGTGHRRGVPSWVLAVLLLIIGAVFPATNAPFEVYVWTAPPLFFVVALFVFLFQGRRVQLWQGENHLLVVEWDFSGEYYKRIKYTDIQAITWRKTQESRVTTIVFAVLTVLLTAFIFAPISKTLRIADAVSAVLLGVLVWQNWILGETCRCSIRTAVQSTDLPSLRRLKQARKMMDALRPRIIAAQGLLAPEELSMRFQQWSASAASTASAASLGYVADDPNAPPRILA